MIIGMSSDPAVAAYHDSIGVGRGDTADAGDPLQGHLGRAFGATYAIRNVAVSGNRISTFLVGNSKRMSLAQYFTHFAINMGINDASNGDSAATIAANTNSMVALFPANSVALCTLSPVSSSTDAWATAKNAWQSKLTLKSKQKNKVNQVKKFALFTLVALAAGAAQAQMVVQAHKVTLQPQIGRDAHGYDTCGIRAVVLAERPDGFDGYDFSINVYNGAMEGMMKAGKTMVSTAEILKGHAVPQARQAWTGQLLGSGRV